MTIDKALKNLNRLANWTPGKIDEEGSWEFGHTDTDPKVLGDHGIAKHGSALDGSLSRLKAAAWTPPKVNKTLAKNVAKVVDKPWIPKSLDDVRNAIGTAVVKPMSMSDRIDFQPAVKAWKAKLSTVDLTDMVRWVESIQNKGRNTQYEMSEEALRSLKGNDEKDSKYEEGKPADPTENMSESEKKEWELNTLKNKDKFKKKEGAKRPTFKAALTAIATHLKKEGWEVKEGLKIPHATSPDDDVRVYFKTQAVYYDRGPPYSYKSARSLHIDIRDLDGPGFVKEVKRWAKDSSEKQARPRASDDWYDPRTATAEPVKSGGLYGFHKGVQADCESAAKRVGKEALKIARAAWHKDEKVAGFLATHAKRSKSLSAEILVAAMKEIGPKFASETENMTKTGAHHQEGKDWFVDTAFVNGSQRFYPGATLSHIGFGEFELKTPDGTLQFDRMRGKDFPGQSGRSHKLYDDAGGKVITKAIEYAEKSGKSKRMAVSVTSRWDSLSETQQARLAEYQARGASADWKGFGGPGSPGGEYWGRRAKDSKHLKMKDNEAKTVIQMRAVPEGEDLDWLAVWWVPPQYVKAKESKFRVEAGWLEPLWVWERGAQPGGVRRASDKTARDYGMYGQPCKTCDLGLQSCANLKSAAGRIASDLHRRRQAKHEKITGFLKTHCKEAGCLHSRLLSASYPGSDIRISSSEPKTVADWLAFED